MKKQSLLALGVLVALPTFADEPYFQYSFGGQTMWYHVLDESTKTCETRPGSSWESDGNYSYYAGNTISGPLTIPSIVYNGSTAYTVVAIGDYAFASDYEEGTSYSNLTGVEIPNTVTAIGKSAFLGCASLRWASIPKSVSNIESGAFYWCTSLTSLELPALLENIGSSSFSYSGLTSIIIPELVKTIGDRTFYECSNLRSVKISESVESVGNSAFRFCSRLESVAIKGDRVLDIRSSFNNPFTGEILVPESVINEYKALCPYYTFISDATPVATVNFTYSGADNNFEIRLNDSRTLTLSLDNADLANGFQTDITLPAGLSIAEKAGKLDVYFGNNTAAETHEITAAKVDGENKYRIVAYSPKNETFKSGVGLLNINIVSDSDLRGGDITIDNTEIILADDTNCNPDAMTIKVPGFISVKKIVLDPSEASLNLGATLKIDAEVMPANAWVKTLTWSSSDESVATVNDEGVVTPLAKGNAVISASATDGSGIKASTHLTVTNYMQSLTIGDDITIEADETMQLNPVFTPADADETELVWSSSDETVAYVDADNVLHALSEGTATITATNAASGLEASFVVTVTPVLYGDSNDNGIVAIDDVVTDVQYILEKNPTPFSFKKADVNRDSRISIIDVSKTVGIILSNTPANAPRRAPGYGGGVTGLIADDVTLTATNKVMTISFGDVEDITALQGDIALPEGVTVAGISISGAQNGDHRVAFAPVDDRSVRFAVYSLSLDRMSCNAPMLEIEFEFGKSFVNSNVEIYDILASDTDSNLMNFNALSVGISNGTTTGIESVTADDEPVRYFLINGTEVKDASTPGFYIVRKGGKVSKVMKN